MRQRRSSPLVRGIYSTRRAAMLAELIERGLRDDRALAFVIDGSKTLGSAIERTLGALALIWRYRVHERRNLLEHLL